MIWHENQKVTKLPEGSPEITFRVAGLDEMKRWVLSFAPEVIILEPQKLRDLVGKSLHEPLTQYPVRRIAVNLMGGSRAV